MDTKLKPCPFCGGEAATYECEKDVDDLASPFGIYDYALMPLALFVATQVGYRFRRYPLVTLPIMAAWSAMAIAYFPLWLGGGIPWWPTAAYIFVSLLVLYLIGYAVLRRTPLWA